MKLFQYLLLTSLITSFAINAGGDTEFVFERNPAASAQYARNQFHKKDQHLKNDRKKAANRLQEAAEHNKNDAAAVTKAVITKHAKSYGKGTSDIYLQGKIRK